mmetsp:Transcript_786/g.1346  ORF Transcript_786/g.1346 Transcript_786/m.1346 type:complete len:322 (-) Transcript_786:210-1175(-)
MSEFSEDGGAMQKLATYQDQLAQIEAYLTSDQTNPEWLKAKHDIENVIKMTETLIQVQQSEGQGGGDSSADTGGQQTRVAENFQAVTSVEVGDKVEVMGDRYYAGVVTAVSSDGDECTLRYYEVGKEVTLPLSKMRKLVSKHGLTADHVAPGLKCQCKFALDRKWYDVEVEESTPHGFMIKYVNFGNKEEVPVEYLRKTPIAVLQGDSRDSGGVVIPEKLKILPTDTEEEKLQKKKRIKGMKSKNRLDAIDKERSAVQNSWKAFSAKKAIKTKTSGGVPHVKKRSMFASPQEVDGRVGVTGSGQAMTQHAERKRYKFNGLK